MVEPNNINCERYGLCRIVFGNIGYRSKKVLWVLLDIIHEIVGDVRLDRAQALQPTYKLNKSRLKEFALIKNLSSFLHQPVILLLIYLLFAIHPPPPKPITQIPGRLYDSKTKLDFGEERFRFINLHISSSLFHLIRTILPLFLRFCFLFSQWFFLFLFHYFSG